MSFEMKNKVENQPFSGNWDGDYREDEFESASLQIGAECLDQFLGNAKEAISRYPGHTAEIVLTSVFNLLTIDEPLDEIFGHVLQLINANDTINYRVQ